MELTGIRSRWLYLGGVNYVRLRALNLKSTFRDKFPLAADLTVTERLELSVLQQCDIILIGVGDPDF